MGYFNEPTLLSFVLQLTLVVIYIPTSYIAYRQTRAPQKNKRVIEELILIGVTPSETSIQVTSDVYNSKHYLWPISLACLVVSFLYSYTHPYFINLGLTTGVLEEVINVFNADEILPRPVIQGRFWFWGWAGAWVYSFQLIFRRYLTYDLTPSVYIFALNRFLLATIVGGILGVGLGTFLTATGTPFDMNMATVSMTVFFIGFFPERGVDWLTAIVQKTLRQKGRIAKEKRLSDIEGLSIWHQGRLKQEGVENVQNLATADIPALIINTPFNVTEIVDWVDQAILLRHTSEKQFKTFEEIGIICASDLLTNTTNDKTLKNLVEATNLAKNELRILRNCLNSALNVKCVTNFRWQSSLDNEMTSRVSTSHVSDIQPIEESTISKLN